MRDDVDQNEYNDEKTMTTNIDDDNGYNDNGNAKEDDDDKDNNIGVQNSININECGKIYASFSIQFPYVYFVAYFLAFVLLFCREFFFVISSHFCFVYIRYYYLICALIERRRRRRASAARIQRTFISRVFL